MLRRLVRFSLGCLMALIVAFILEIIYETLYEKLNRTAEYTAVYSLPPIDASMKICFVPRDSCACILIMYGESQEYPAIVDTLHIRKSRNGPRMKDFGYEPVQLKFFSNICYIKCSEEWREKYVTFSSSGSTCDGANRNIDYTLSSDSLRESSDLADSCIISVFLYNELQSAIITYGENMFGESLRPAKERRISYLKSWASNIM